MRVKEIPVVSYATTEVKTYDIVKRVIDLNGHKKIVMDLVERVDDPNKDYDAEDFSLQSLLDAGAVDLLKPVGSIAPDVLDAIDSTTKGLDSIVTELMNEPVEESSVVE